MRVVSLLGPKVTGGIALAALAVAALAGGAWLLQGSGHHNQVVATTASNPDGTRTDYVGYALDPFSATAGYDAADVAKALDAWRAAHPGAQILDQEPVEKAGLVVGSRIHYR